MELLEELRNYLEDIKAEKEDFAQRVKMAKEDFEQGFNSGQRDCYRQVQWALEDILEREERKQCL